MADLMKKANGILESSQEALVNVTHTTANLSSISAKIDKGQGTVGALINDKNIYTQLDQTTRGLRDTVTKAQAGVTRLSGKHGGAEEELPAARVLQESWL